MVGRGLSVATGTIGAALALGLLWLMVPHSGRGSDVATEISTTSVRAAPPGTAPAARVTPEATAGSGVPKDSLAATTELVDTTISQAPPMSSATVITPLPPPTMVLGSQGETPEVVPPVAVALVPGHLVVTTAAAVRGRQGFAVQLPTGETVVGAVVLVDSANGVAVLSVTIDIDDSLIEASLADLAAGGFMLMNPEATAASLWENDDGTQVGYDQGDEPDSATGEGSLVLDGDGRLIGMCTKSATGVQLVGVAALLDALASASADSTAGWLGIEAEVDSSGSVAVAAVVAGGPAAAAGIHVGDVIAAIDGIAVPDLETLRSVVGAHAAGEMVTLTIRKSSVDSTTTTSVGTTSTTLATSTSTGESTINTTDPTVAESTSPANTSPANETLDIVVTLSQHPGSL